jgi:hypothetical protein
MPFGKYKGLSLAMVPGSYLAWVLREVKLSSGLRAAVADELARRGVPAPAPPRPLRACPLHPGDKPICLWSEDTLGRRLIRCECPTCHRATDYAPLVSPYTDEADRNASPTPVLDVLMKLDEIDVELCSDGRTAWIDNADQQRVPPALHAIIRQCRHQLARMLGKDHGAVPCASSTRPARRWCCGHRQRRLNEDG